MNPNPVLSARVNVAGQLILPSELGTRYGFKPGAKARIDTEPNGVRIRRSVAQLAKIYVEPTSRCNLSCVTCVRNVWQEPMGQMSDAIWESVVTGLRAFSPPPSVFFGGFGEPTFHPQIVEMVAQARAVGAAVELITNGTRLTPDLARELVHAGLSVLWVSIDGATPESYGDVRLGAALPQVIENVARFRDMRAPAQLPKPEIGIVFVAMKRNIADLPQVIRLGRRLGASRFMVSNVLAHTPAMADEALYYGALADIGCLPSRWAPQLNLPRMDVYEATYEPVYLSLRLCQNVVFAGHQLGDANDYCPFIEKGATAIRWDGKISPCLPLMHSHITFLQPRSHLVEHHAFGDLNAQTLAEVWRAPEYVRFRERVQVFDFAPCLACGGCEMFEANREDCFGNTFPTCSGCLWARGIIQCP